MDNELKKILAEQAIRAFFLYEKKYLKGSDAFILPEWFNDARTLFTHEEVSKMYQEEMINDNSN